MNTPPKNIEELLNAVAGSSDALPQSLRERRDAMIENLAFVKKTYEDWKKTVETELKEKYHDCCMHTLHCYSGTIQCSIQYIDDLVAEAKKLKASEKTEAELAAMEEKARAYSERQSKYVSNYYKNRFGLKGDNEIASGIMHFLGKRLFSDEHVSPEGDNPNS